MTMRPGRLAVLLAGVLLVGVAAVAGPAGATPDGWSEVDEDSTQVRGIIFPVDGETFYTDSWLDSRGGGRRHLGVDMMAEKMTPVLAVRDSCVTYLDYGGPSGGNMLELTDDDGWSFRYIHLNNDTPGTDDGANPREYAFADGLETDDCVEAGDVVSWVGDSGNAEGAHAHLHFEVRRPDGVWINPYWTVLAAEQAGGDNLDGDRDAASCGVPDVPEPHPDAASGRGYWLLDSDGVVHAFGDAEHHGDLSDVDDAAAPIAMRATTTGDGYWIVDADGVVHDFGDAEHHGDMSGTRLNGPVLGIEARPDGDGYWLVADDGGVFSFEAPFFGSMGSTPLNAPVISMAATATGLGYHLIAADGGVFSFGDAAFYGSTGGKRLAAPVISAAVSPLGGYWLYARDGGVFAFGTDFYGSVPGLALCDDADTVAFRGSQTGHGYWLAADDGRVFAFGDAVDHGDLEDLDDGVTVVDLAVAFTP